VKLIIGLVILVVILIFIAKSKVKSEAKKTEKEEAVEQEMKYEGIKELDDNHIALLSLFQNPRTLDNPYWQEAWSETLNRPYKSVIEYFIKQNLLTEASNEQKLAVSLRVSDIKQVLKENRLKVSGTKTELLNRLIENMPEEAKKIASSVSDVYACTNDGTKIAQAYKNKIDIKRQDAEEEVRIFLKQKKVNKAARIVNQFLASLPCPLAHGGAMPNDAQAILEIKSVQGMTNEELEKVRLEAASDAIWGENIRGPKQFLSIAYKQMSMGI
jgi:hypothetical protein